VWIRRGELTSACTAKLSQSGVNSLLRLRRRFGAGTLGEGPQIPTALQIPLDRSLIQARVGRRLGTIGLDNRPGG